MTTTCRRASQNLQTAVKETGKEVIRRVGKKRKEVETHLVSHNVENMFTCSLTPYREETGQGTRKNETNRDSECQESVPKVVTCETEKERERN